MAAADSTVPGPARHLGPVWAQLLFSKTTEPEPDMNRGRTEGSRFTWSVDGDQLALHNEGEDRPIELSYLLRDNTLVLTREGGREAVCVRPSDR